MCDDVLLGIQGEFHVVEINERVWEQVRKSGHSAVLIVCDDHWEPVTEALRAASLKFSDETAEMGSLKAVVNESDLQKLQTIDGILVIEPDEEVSTL
jgi:hypothetical protein